MEGEERCGIPFLLEGTPSKRLSSSYWGRLWFIRWNLPGLGLDVEEDDLFSVAIVVLRADDVLSTVLQLDTVDNKCVVLPSIPLHEFDTLPELGVVVIPGECGGGDGYHSACEFGTLSFE